MANYIWQKTNKHIALISTNEDVNEILASVNFEAVFDYIEAPRDEDWDYTSIETKEKDKDKK